MKNNDIRVGDLVYAPTHNDDGKLYKVVTVYSSGCELLHNNESFNIDSNVVFIKNDANIKALSTLYPKIRFDGYLYYYGNLAMDKLLERKTKKSILSMAYFSSRNVYVNIVDRNDDYYIDNFGSRWANVTPVELDSNGNLNEVRVINNEKT